MTSIGGRIRPFLLTGDLGVGKTFLSRRLAAQDAAHYSLTGDQWLPLLADTSLPNLTPETLVRYLRDLVEKSSAPYSVADGLDPLLSLWAVERPGVLPNFFSACSRAILERPLLVVIQTSAHVPSEAVCQERWWPRERRFRLELTQADKEAVAANWGLDPMRARIAGNLYELLAVRLER